MKNNRINCILKISFYLIAGFLFFVTVSEQAEAQFSFGTTGQKEEQKSEEESRGPSFGASRTIKWRSGMVFEALSGGTCTDILGTIPVPMEYPEQKVRIIEENFPNVARVGYRELKEGGVKELCLRMRTLQSGQKVEATVLFEVTRIVQIPPKKTDCYKVPKKLNRQMRQYLKKGPFIETDSKMVKELTRSTVADKKDAWDKVKAIFEGVRKKVKYNELLAERPVQGAMAAVRNGEGDCEDMCALFIAMCRIEDIPARLVRVEKHCYAEFYLEDENGKGYWFPAQVAGLDSIPLGFMDDPRVIFQKGECFRLPESPKEESFYVKECFTGSVKENAPDPVYHFIHALDTSK